MKNKKINYGPITTFSNYALISENKLVKETQVLKQHGPSYFAQDAYLLTGMGMIYNEAKPKKRDYFINWTWWNWFFFNYWNVFSKGIKNFIVLRY